MYFGHPVNTYNTDLEKELLEAIQSFFSDGVAPVEIENPNQPHHSKNYLKWKETHGDGMRYFFEEVLPSCDVGVFLPFRDGAFGAGVFGEMKWFYEKGLDIFTIYAHGTIFPVFWNGVLWIRRLRNEDKKFEDLVKVLSVEETRARIRTADNKTIPY